MHFIFLFHPSLYSHFSSSLEALAFVYLINALPIHSRYVHLDAFNKYTVATVSGTVVGVRNTARRKTVKKKISCFHGAYILWE